MFQLGRHDYDVLTGHLNLRGCLNQVEVVRNRFRDYGIEMRIVERL